MATYKPALRKTEGPRQEHGVEPQSSIQILLYHNDKPVVDPKEVVVLLLPELETPDLSDDSPHVEDWDEEPEDSGLLVVPHRLPIV